MPLYNFIIHIYKVVQIEGTAPEGKGLFEVILSLRCEDVFVDGRNHAPLGMYETL